MEDGRYKTLDKSSNSPSCIHPPGKLPYQTHMDRIVFLSQLVLVESAPVIDSLDWFLSKN